MRPRKPSPSTLIALLALFVALGGSSYAALQVPKGSVGTKQLKNNAVTSKKIKNGAVNSNKVKNGSLLSADFRAGQLPAGPPGERGPQGERGAQGVPGPAGAAGAPGSAIAFARVEANGSLVAASSKNVAILAHPVPGAYCLDVTAGQAPLNVVATIAVRAGAAATDGIWASVEPAVVSFNCGGTNADTIVGTTDSANTAVDRAFYVAYN